MAVEHYPYVILGGGAVGRMIAYYLCASPPHGVGLSPGEVVVVDRGTPSVAAWGTHYLHAPVPGLATSELLVYTLCGRVDPSDLGGTLARAELLSPDRLAAYKSKTGGMVDDVYPWWRYATLRRAWGIGTPYPYAAHGISGEVTALHLEDYRVVCGEVELTYDHLLSTISLRASLQMAGDGWAGAGDHLTSSPLHLWRLAMAGLAPAPGGVLGELRRRRRAGAVGWDEMVVIYDPDPDSSISRMSLRGSTLCYESYVDVRPPVVPEGTEALTVPARLGPRGGPGMVLSLLRSLNVWCLGRLGAWQPRRLLHETYAELLRDTPRLLVQPGVVGDPGPGGTE